MEHDHAKSQACDPQASTTLDASEGTGTTGRRRQECEAGKDREGGEDQLGEIRRIDAPRER
jgi:hypothetical protein